MNIDRVSKKQNLVTANPLAATPQLFVEPQLGLPAAGVSNIAKKMTQDIASIKRVGDEELKVLMSLERNNGAGPTLASQGYNPQMAFDLTRQKISAGRMDSDDLFASYISGGGEDGE